MFPNQIVEIGIAEQNLVGVSAGLASYGKRVFAVSPACFLTARALEQIKNDVAYSNQPVKIIGISAGVSYGSLGTTHHSLHDFAALLAINNIDIVAFLPIILRQLKPFEQQFSTHVQFTFDLVKSHCPICMRLEPDLRLVRLSS